MVIAILKPVLVLVLSLVFVAPEPSGAQVGAEWRGATAAGLQMDRAQLQELLDELRGAAASPAYSEQLRARARSEAALIEQRLTAGDFRVGDRVALSVETAPQLSDTFRVEAGPRIEIPTIGPISLAGVLRAELEEHLTRELEAYVREPRLRAEALVRLGVQGTVGQPGFYTVPADMLLGELLMTTGGPAPDAAMDELRIQRGTRTIWEGQSLQEAISEGLTLDQLSLRAGDQLVVPVRPPEPWWDRYLIPIGLPLVTSGIIAGVLR